jgi:hypothetical protein
MLVQQPTEGVVDGDPARGATGALDTPAASRTLDPGSVLGRRVTLSQRIVRRLTNSLDGRTNRRGFLTRVAVVASALSVDPFGFVFRPRTAYASVCGPASTCGEGWSVFCCTINAGRNECPPGSFIAGWWKADSSSWCGGRARYYVDCNASCSSPCTCYCPTGTCDNRRTCCNQFRYGQCNQQIACYGPVVCRLVSCTAPYLWDASCTTTLAVSNATAEHSAPCVAEPPQVNPPPPPPPPSILFGPGVGNNADGRLEVFMTGADKRLSHTWQNSPNGGWASWRSFDGWAVGSPGVAANADGRLEVFYVGTDFRIWHHWQVTAGGAWSASSALDRNRTWPDRGAVAAARNADGRLEVFCVGRDKLLWHCYQYVPNGNWSPWIPLGSGSWQSSAALGVNADGRLEVFVIGEDGRLWHSWQVVPNGDWSGFLPLGSRTWPAGTTPSVTRNKSGRLEVFLTGADRQLWHIWQVAPNSDWSGWLAFGGGWRGTPAAGANADGRLEVFIEDDDKAIWHAWQVRPDGTWSSFASLGGNFA